MDPLFDNNYAPVRSFANLTEFEEHFRHRDTLIIDATEQPVQRPGDQDEQKLNYSGKKRHTVKIGSSLTRVKLSSI